MSNKKTVRRSPARRPAAGSSGTRSQLPSKGSNLAALLPLLIQSDLFAIDGYTNPAAFLGEASPLIASGDFVRSYIGSNPEKLTVMYRENWLAKRIIDMPCEDMTRSWYSLSTDMSDDDIYDLKRLEAIHSVKQELTNAIRWARLYGGALAVIVIRGQEDVMDQPLDLDMIAPGDFRGLLVLDRAQGVSPSSELESDIDDPDFGLPMFYDANVEIDNQPQTIRIHHSRVLRFVGRELPKMEMMREEYWGAPELEHVLDELQKRNSTSANIAQLIFQANITTLKMGDFGEALAMGTDEQRNNATAAIALENRFRTSFGLQLLSKDDSMENHPYSFSGLADVYEQFMMDICGAAEIPATKLFGRSPQGFNSTGESDMRNYYDTIAQMQERILRPALEKLVPIEALSCWGFVPEEMEIVFEPIAAITPSDRADLISKVSSPIIEAYKAKLISRDEAVAELKAIGADYGIWTKLYLHKDDADPDPDDDLDDDPDNFDDDDPDDDPDDDGILDGQQGGGPVQTMGPAASPQQAGIVSSIDQAEAPR